MKTFLVFLLGLGLGAFGYYLYLAQPQSSRVTALPSAVRPQILLGGYAVKMGTLEPISGAQQLADIRLL